MAKQEQARFEFDDWVGVVRPDPRSTEQLTLLQGFIGQSSETGHIRVYSDESLNGFVEVPEESIVYAQKVSATESALGGSRIWVRSDVVVTYGDPKSANRPKSTFLEGDIMQQYGTFAGQPDTTQMGGQPDTTGQLAPVPTNLCGPITLVNRPSVCMICPTTVRVTCLRSVCQIATCFRTICGIATCRNTLCYKSCFITACGIPTDRWTITPTTPQQVVQPGANFMGGQPDTTQMGGYYGTFNPYMY